ncbi:unnamed protein product, partial [Brassica rapa subsp. narinosa]
CSSIVVRQLTLATIIETCRNLLHVTIIESPPSCTSYSLFGDFIAARCEEPVYRREIIRGSVRLTQLWQFMC